MYNYSLEYHILHDMPLRMSELAYPAQSECSPFGEDLDPRGKTLFYTSLQSGFSKVT